MITLHHNYQEAIETILKNRTPDDLIIDYWNDISISLTEPYKERIYEWLTFFETVFNFHHVNNHRINISSLINYSTIALLKLSVDEDWFYQTRHEFDISKKFIEQIVSSGHLIYFSDELQPLFFIKISIVYSNYYGYVNASVIKASQHLYPHPSLDNQANFFRELFSKYSNACSLTLYKNLLHMSFTDLKLFMQLISGLSLRKIQSPFAFSKKQTNIFLHNLPDFVIMKNGVYREGWHISRLLVINNVRSFFFQFYYGLKMDSSQNSVLIRDFDYWETVYRYLTFQGDDLEEFNMENLGNISIRDILDYLTYKKYTEKEPVDLKNKSIKKLCRTIQEWEFSHYKMDLKPKEKRVWETSPLASWQISYLNKTFEIAEITDNFSLFKEGRYMKHCVYFYLGDCLEKNLKIFSLRILKKNKIKKLVTIELREKRVVQARGKYNRLIDEQERNVIEEWCKFYNFEFLIM